mgnify:CR=1 FL=1
MNSSKNRVIAFLMVTALLFSLFARLGNAQPSAEALRKRLIAILNELVKIEGLGYNVTLEVKELNRALALIRKYERGGSPEYLVEAREILSKLESELPSLKVKAEEEKRFRDLMLALSILFIFVLVGAFTYLVFIGIWKIWYYIRRDWVVVPA